jgi:hypothetical protein
MANLAVGFTFFVFFSRKFEYFTIFDFLAHLVGQYLHIQACIAGDLEFGNFGNFATSLAPQNSANTTRVNPKV